MLRKQFEVKQIAEKKVLELYLYGEIRSDWYDWWNGQIVESTTSANYVRKAVSEAGEVDEIKVYINSCGGSVDEGNAIYNILKRSTAEKTVYVDAFAYSVASVIAMAGDKVIMPSNTTMMIHNAMMGAYGNSKELRQAADNLDTINEASCNTYLVKAKDKLTREQLNELLDAETFFTAEEALAYGLCDEIIDPVDTDGSEEVVKQALENNNPVAQKVIKQLKKVQTAQTGSPKSKQSEPEPDCFDWLREKFNMK